MDVPKTRYTRAADGAYIAYQVLPGGPTDLLYLPGWHSHLEVYWEQPRYARFMRRLSSWFRVITFDERGTGLSERTVALPHIDTMLEDVRAVLEAASAKRTVLWGDGPDGGGSCAVFAASFPEQTRALVWWSCHARSLVAPDYPWGFEEERLADEEEFVERACGGEGLSPDLLRFIGCSSLADDTAAQEWICKFYRYAATPGGARAFFKWYNAIDVRSVLPVIRVPTVVFPDAGPEAVEEARYVAAQIPGAKLMTRTGPDFPPWVVDVEANVAAVQGFLASVAEEEAALDRVLATVLYTDIVGSTDKATALGDSRWKELLGRHHLVVRAMLERYRGTEVKTTGDGFLATFDGPARAVKCAQGICEAVKALDLEVRAGCHTGEIELLGADVGGVAVHIGARIAALAGPSEVLVSSTVRDLVVGSGLTFSDRGSHALKGVPGRWKLFACRQG
jgi:class 3 adenylate cyclase